MGKSLEEKERLGPYLPGANMNTTLLMARLSYLPSLKAGLVRWRLQSVWARLFESRSFHSRDPGLCTKSLQAKVWRGKNR
jgi:hypothetical protein